MREISAKGPYARKFAIDVREVELAAPMKGDPGYNQRIDAATKELWIWVKKYTILENEVIDLREEVARLRELSTKFAQAQGPPGLPAQDAITAKEAGPWFDSSRGIYIPAMVILEAIDRGWKGASECEGLTDEEITNLEDYIEISEEAESWFNERAPAGYYFGTHPDHGDWGLWQIEDDSGEDEGTTVVRLARTEIGGHEYGPD